MSALVSLPTPSPVSTASPRIKGIGFEFWTAFQGRKRDKPVQVHLSFMVDGMELVMLGGIALIAWYLGFRLPEPPPPDTTTYDPQRGLGPGDWSSLTFGPATKEKAFQLTAPASLSPEFEDLRERRARLGWYGVDLTRGTSTGGFVGASGTAVGPSGGVVGIGTPTATGTTSTGPAARPGGSSALIV